MGSCSERGRIGVVAIAGLAIVGCSLTALDGFDADDPSRPGENGQPQGSSGTSGGGSSGGSGGDGAPGSSGTSGTPGPNDPSGDASPDAPPMAPRTGDGSCLTPYRLGPGIHTLPGCSAMYPRKCGAAMPVIQIATDLPTATITVEGPSLWRLTSPACTSSSSQCSSASGVSQSVTPTDEIVVGRRNDTCQDLRVLVAP